MLKNLLVDTNVLIDYSKGKSELLEKYLADRQWQLTINPVIVAEFSNDQQLSNSKKLQQTKDFLNLFNHFDLNQEIGYKTGELLRKKQADFLGDALVAATCLIGKMPLLTRNQKHFKKVKGLKLAR